MNFYLLPLFLLFSLVTSTPFQPSNKNPNDSFHHQNSLPLQQSASELTSYKTGAYDSFYLTGCTAVLKGLDDVDSIEQDSERFFASWENQNPDLPFLHYFENKGGLVSKSWIDKSYGDTWTFELKIYDGNYIDQKVASVQFSINAASEMSIIQSNGSFTTLKDITLNVQYGENNNLKFKKYMTGELSVFFLHSDTQKPVTDFEKYNTRITTETLQIMFINTDQSFSFKTSLFTREFFMLSSFDKIACYAFVALYILINFISVYTSSLGQKVKLDSLQAVQIYASFFLFWVLYSPYYYGTFYIILLIPAVIQFALNVFFLMANSDNYDGCYATLGVFASLLLSLLGFFNTIWISLLPNIVMFVPLLRKIINRRDGPQDFITRFELSYWACMCLWISYAYLYPHNFYLFAPKPLFVSVYCGSIFLQFLISLIMHRVQHRRAAIESLLQEENPISLQITDTEPEAYQFGTDNGNNNASNDKRHRYTIYTANEKDVDRIITNECAICCDELMGKEQRKLYKTPCNHVFHEDCLKDWGLKKLECPVCRMKLPRFKNPYN